MTRSCLYGVTKATPVPPRLKRLGASEEQELLPRYARSVTSTAGTTQRSAGASSGTSSTARRTGSRTTGRTDARATAGKTRPSSQAAWQNRWHVTCTSKGSASGTPQTHSTNSGKPLTRFFRTSVAVPFAARCSGGQTHVRRPSAAGKQARSTRPRIGRVLALGGSLSC
jgi:hypothetical protein